MKKETKKKKVWITFDMDRQKILVAEPIGIFVPVAWPKGTNKYINNYGSAESWSEGDLSCCDLWIGKNTNGPSIKLYFHTIFFYCLQRLNYKSTIRQKHKNVRDNKHFYTV